MGTHPPVFSVRVANKGGLLETKLVRVANKGLTGAVFSTSCAVSVRVAGKGVRREELKVECSRFNEEEDLIGEWAQRSKVEGSKLQEEGEMDGE